MPTWFAGERAYQANDHCSNARRASCDVNYVEKLVERFGNVRRCRILVLRFEG
jgi:hypothetical protein